MPNWVEGSLKVRSKNANNVKDFFKNAFEYQCMNCPNTELKNNMKCRITVGGNEELCPHANCYGDLILIEDEDYDTNQFSIMFKDSVYLKDSSRVFVGKNKEEIDTGYYSNKTVVLPFQAAWGLHPDEWVELSKKYNVDFRLYGFEQGMEFCEELEVINGEITLFDEIHYKDWDWECPMPRMGG